MTVRVESVDPVKKKTEALCFFVSEKSEEPFGLPNLDKMLQLGIRQACKETKGKIGSISVVHTHQIIPAQRIIIVGIGPRHKITHEQVRLAAGKIAKKTSEMGLSEICLVIPDRFPLKTKVAANSAIEGVHLASYSFDKYKPDKKQKTPSLTLLATGREKVSDIISRAQTVSDGVIYARSIANLPPNECNPEQLASFAKSLAAKSNLKCTILSKSELKQKGFGGISAVGQGSKNEPKLIILEYSGKKGEKPILIVGKAVTFDTGGISLKPADKMDEMKFDKCGGCTVLGIMKAVAGLNLPVNLVGIIPSVENMPGGESYRPGDIIRLYGGKTAEILNTDAEGRLILFDALSYGIKTYSPKEVIDFATLTGACIVALGTNVAGLVSNNKKIAERIIRASERTGEQVWQLPINDDYMEMIKSDYAEIKNVGPGRVAGTITAAAFLANAVGNTPWAHFDIAGTAWIQTGSKDKSYNPKGATGFGVRLILDYLSNP
ncbi:leucyl aminopeptidase [Candidatus Nitrosotenuis uzonensis]|uniref:Probable cytosol aminopeptidase n=1 Tax=Candidatus Nitrosotenuis uzonensis TaxID=1407055 RepID=V6AUN1_9ARCH|nr:leucyl aminopeptidase [Candidatus Nitrosotenuis uzonensis]CDI06220.1 Putative cytosol aminopeptidase (Leucine aminopeptidase) (LAP) (Leucyl aminopeptidase) PepA [Candidatus Nitrosotenuis uzonensis]